MPTDYSPEAIAKRLRQVSELRRIGLSLAKAGEAIRETPDKPIEVPPRPESNPKPDLDES
ncbi:MAG TPA: hypothetical protein VIL97_10480 [Thermoanaerobaculia bacterium]